MIDAGPEASVCTLPDHREADPDRCTRSTTECVRRCAGETGCIETCLRSDTAPPEAGTGRDCETCVLERYLACLDGPDCSEAVEAYRCCELDCVDAADCETRCGAELDAIDACALRPAAQRCGVALASATDGCHPPRFDDTSCDATVLPEASAPGTEPRCSADTAACIRACASPDDFECQVTCLLVDGTPPSATGEDCFSCTDREYSACVASAGCEEEVRQRFCCEAQACPPGSAEDCAIVWCSEESDAADNCGFVEPRCAQDFVDASSACFPSP